MPSPALTRPDLRARTAVASSKRPAAVRALVAVVAAALVVLAGLWLGGPARADGPGGSTSAGSPGATPGGSSAPVVFVGVTGLRWDDVSTLTTPTLWNLSRDASVGLVTTRSVAARGCPADGWLAVSAGDRAADQRGPGGVCRTLVEPGTDGTVPAWSDYAAAVATQPYDAHLGLLGDALAKGGTDVTGIGPGAAIALASSSGTVVGTHVDAPSAATTLTAEVEDALTHSRLVVVDAGVIRDTGFATQARAPGATSSPDDTDQQGLIPGDTVEPPPLTTPEVITQPARAQQVQDVDARIGAAMAGARASGATVLVVSIADSGRTSLQLAAATGVAPNGGTYAENLLTSGSTRQSGLIQTVDVTPTLLDAMGLDAAAADLGGATIVPVAGAASATARMAGLLSMQHRSYWITKVSGAFTTRIVLGQALLFVVAAIVLTRRGRADRRPLRPALRVVQVAGIALGAAPVASFLTGLVPWWNVDHPIHAFWWTLYAWVAVITLVAFAGPWRRYVLGPAGVVALVTVATFVIDPFTGSHLVIDSAMGAHRLLAARFYGMSNQSFALLLAAGVLLGVVIGDVLLRRDRRRLAVVAVSLLGLLCVVVDGTPGLGSDFGGPPALILAFAMLAVSISGRRVNWKVLAIIVGAGVLVVGGFAVIDYLRPPADRTHLGRFVASSLDGGLGDTIGRKLSANLRVLTSWRYLLLAIAGVGLTWIVVANPRPRRGALLGRGSPLAGLRRAVPLLRPGVAAMGCGLLVGFLINDSGIVVPATGIAVAVPCLVAAAAQWRLDHPTEDPDDEEPAPDAAPVELTT
ncbi:hypothetical protein [Cellulomonas alba]|uniref:Phosphoglyceromutase n=1 Tax=Cellulomonas alba TaxID=3053467 RepID=A0ABT7SG82_9CELL|nr:hypothetical protein [Cellulomonas alba]MDM7855191.1 hypothetical protein [Cellulomonas alba]